VLKLPIIQNALDFLATPKCALSDCPYIHFTDLFEITKRLAEPLKLVSKIGGYLKDLFGAKLLKVIASSIER